MIKIESSHVLVTGGNRGIGEAIAEEALRRGAMVTIAARVPNHPDYRSTRDRFTQSYPGKVNWLTLDLADRQSIESTKSYFEANAVDILVNNAGLLTGGLLEKQSTDEVYAMFQVNLVGLTHLTQIALPPMLERRRGIIVNNSSVSGVMNFPLASTYSAAKTGVMALSRCLQAELKGTGVRCMVAVTPGVKTRMFDEIPKKYGEHLDRSFMQSSVTPESWAKNIFDALERGEDEVLPAGATRLGVGLAQHFPGLFGRIVAAKFKR